MKYRSVWIKMITGIMMAILLYSIVFVDLREMTRFIFAVMVILLFALFVLAERMKNDAFVQRLLDEEIESHHRQLIDAYTQHRHDWMNDIQVLFGYVVLKKHDNLMPYLDKIKQKMMQEMNITRLGDASLSAYILTFPINHDELKLQLELPEELNLYELPIPAEQSARFLEDVLELFVRSTKEDDEANGLKMRLTTENDSLSVRMDYTGSFDMALVDVELEKLVQYYQTREHLTVSIKSNIEIGKAIVIIHIPHQ